jgi:lipopolysaccharide export system permease protein
MFSPLVLPRMDRYVARGFFLFLALCVGAVVALIVIGDLFERTEEFTTFAGESEMEAAAMLHEVLRFYLSFAPGLLLRWLLPLVLLMAAVFSVTASNGHNEYVALRASGVSIQRAVLPHILLALLLSYGAEWTRDWYLPSFVRTSRRLENEVRGRDKAQPLGLVVEAGGETHHVSMGHFDGETAYNLWIEVRDLEGYYEGSEAFRVYRAQRAELRPRTALAAREEGDPRENEWSPRAEGMTFRQGRYERTEPEPWRDPLPTVVTRAMLERQALGEAVMTWEDLRQLAPALPEIRMEMWRRRTEPWAAAVLVLLGVSLVLRVQIHGEKTGYVRAMMLAIGAGLAFYVLRMASVNWGETGALPPFVAGWLPVLLTAVLGGWVYYRLEH